jgi:hypothetical protein
MLHDIGLKLVTDVSGQLIGPIVKNQAVYDGKGMLSQSVGKKTTNYNIQNRKGLNKCPDSISKSRIPCY